MGRDEGLSPRLTNGGSKTLCEPQNMNAASFNSHYFLTPTPLPLRCPYSKGGHSDHIACQDLDILHFSKEEPRESSPLGEVLLRLCREQIF